MSWLKGTTLLLPLLAANAVAGEGYILGAGIEGDSEDGLAVSLIGDVGLAENTWLSAAIARNTADLEIQRELDTWYADVGIDHWWEPIGIRAGAAYWGDDDTLDSTDWRASLYWRADGFSVAGDLEYRDFTFQFPATDRFAGRKVGFDANGVGVTANFDVTESIRFGVSAMDYDYSVNLRLDQNRGLLTLLSFSRLSLINSLIDYRASATLGLDAGERRWQFEAGTWRGEVDGSNTLSATIRFMNPLGDNADIELALGVDDSELYGKVTFLSAFLFFYGGS